jgi:hypothetical protein
LQPAVDFNQGGVMSATSQTVDVFTVRAIEPTVCDELRACDDLANAPEVRLDTEGGNPLRCCLTLSRPGEQVMLVSHAPLRRWAAAHAANPGPYLEIGPVFLHPTRCDGPSGAGYPDAYRGLPRVLRAYDADGRIIGGTIVDGAADPEPVIEAIFDDDQVAFVHARAPVAGCFTFWIDRAGIDTSSS